jgi:hypothetical protein
MAIIAVSPVDARRVMGDGHEFMRFSELGDESPLIEGRARWTRRAPIRMIRKRRCAAPGQGQMIVVQYPESFEAGSTARRGSCTPR